MGQLICINRYHAAILFCKSDYANSSKKITIKPMGSPEPNSLSACKKWSTVSKAL